MYIGPVSISYDGVPIFDQFCVDIDSSIQLIMGPSGCGKTTLLKHLFDDSLNLRRAILVLQDDGLIPWYSGIKNIEHFSLQRPRARQEKPCNHKLFPLIESFCERPAWTMSFGQRRSIEIFRAILSLPDVMYLDEPFNYLDPKRRKEFANYICTEMGGVQMIIATHEPEDFRPYLNKALVFDGALPVRSAQIVTL